MCKFHNVQVAQCASCTMYKFTICKFRYFRSRRLTQYFEATLLTQTTYVCARTCHTNTQDMNTHAHARARARASAYRPSPTYPPQHTHRYKCVQARNLATTHSRLIDFMLYDCCVCTQVEPFLKRFWMLDVNHDRQLDSSDCKKLAELSDSEKAAAEQALSQATQGLTFGNAVFEKLAQAIPLEGAGANERGKRLSQRSPNARRRTAEAFSKLRKHK
eukprot:5144198-Pleurochrysis_carterae.AAC.1